MRHYDPPLTEQHWTTLPFPFEEMQGAVVDVHITDRPPMYSGFLHIDRHETDDTLFSPVLVISDLRGDHPASLRQLRVRLSPSLAASIRRARMDGADRYALRSPLSALGCDYLPDQLKA